MTAKEDTSARAVDQIYFVTALRQPGPAFHHESGLLNRIDAIAVVRQQWALGRKARLNKT